MKKRENMKIRVLSLSVHEKLYKRPPLALPHCPSTMLLAPLLFLAAQARAQDDCTDPLAKCVIRAMDEMISDHVAWDNKTAWTAIMEKFFTADMVYDTNYR